MTSTSETRISVGILRRQDRVWIQRRPASTHLGGHWEFPGGKLEPGETPLDGLLRELAEETGFRPTREDPRLVWVQPFTYPDRSLLLFFFIVELGGEFPAGAGRWSPVSDLEKYHFPSANVPILRWLQGDSQTRGAVR